MATGYERPLYVLPFDHRHSYIAGLFHFKPPLTREQHEQVADSKRVIYEGFALAIARGVPRECAGILVDEEFGAPILRDAADSGCIVALSTEKSGSNEFDFEYGSDYARHIAAFDPAFVKVLVRYNPDGDSALNRRQRERLKELSAYCARSGRLFMFELLVPATQEQLERVHDDLAAYDLRMRPELVLRSIAELQDSGVDPDVWKIEALDRREDCERVVAMARRDGRNRVSCIVLGRGADADKVGGWLTTAAPVPGFIGFAVGRTTFWDPIVDYLAGRAARPQTADRIAERYTRWIAIFERARGTGTN